MINSIGININKINRFKFHRAIFLVTAFLILGWSAEAAYSMDQESSTEYGRNSDEESSYPRSRLSSVERDDDVYDGESEEEFEEEYDVETSGDDEGEVAGEGLRPNLRSYGELTDVPMAEEDDGAAVIADQVADYAAGTEAEAEEKKESERFFTVDEIVENYRQKFPGLMEWGQSSLRISAPYQADCRAHCQGPCQGIHRTVCVVSYETAALIFARGLLPDVFLEDEDIFRRVGTADFIFYGLEQLCKGLAQLMKSSNSSVSARGGAESGTDIGPVTAIDPHLQTEIATLIALVPEFDGLAEIHAMPEPFLTTDILKRSIRNNVDRALLIAHYQTALDVFQSYGQAFISTLSIEERH